MTPSRGDIGPDPAPLSAVDAEARYRTVVTQALDGVIVADMWGNVTEINDAACTMLGRPREELLGLGIVDLCSPEACAPMAQALTGMPPGSARSVRPVVKRPDSTEFFADIVAQTLPNGEMLAIVRDATHAVTVERSLREAHARAERRAEESAALMRAARAVLEHDTFVGAARAVLTACKEFLGASEGVLMLLDEDGVVAEVVCAEGSAHRSHSASADASAPRDVLVAPLVLGEKTVGLLELANKPVGFEDADLELASVFAEITAIALDSIRNREHLAADELRLRLLFEGARDAIFWADAETGLLLDCNNAAEELVGKDRSQIVGAHQSTLHPQENPKRYRTLFEGHAAGTLPGIVEAEVLHSDGRTVPVEISTARVDVDGTLVLQGIFRDLTDRVRAEQRHRSLFRTMLDGVAVHEIICDEDGVPIDYRFLDVNPAFEELTGLKAADVVGRTVLEALPDTEPCWIERYGRVALTGEEAHFEEYSAALDRYFEVKAYRPAPGQFAAVFVDRTQRHRAEQELASYRHRLSELTAELLRSGERERRRAALELHDGVGQTLAAAKIAAQKLTDICGGDKSEEIDRVVELIGHSIAGVRTLTNELSPPVLYELGLGPALGWLVEDYRSRYDFDCSLSIEPAVAGLKGDSSTLLFRAARELLNNVRCHSGLNQARIGVESRGDFVVLRVSDEGRGFNPSLSTKARPDERFGLLSIREEVSLAGGTVEMDSQPGQGARVDVRVPPRLTVDREQTMDAEDDG